MAFISIPKASAVAIVAALTACAQQQSLNQRLPYTVDFLRQPDGEPRSDAEWRMNSAACERDARYAAQRIAIVGLSLPPIATLTLGRDIQNATEAEFLTCLESRGYTMVATQAEKDAMNTKARATRLAGD